ncbi:MAG: hypothetical protein PHE74_12340 [Comamonas sp.]|nr:hypothetical protein [Comamonas sp.]
MPSPLEGGVVGPALAAEAQFGGVGVDALHVLRAAFLLRQVVGLGLRGGDADFYGLAFGPQAHALLGQHLFHLLALLGGHVGHGLLHLGHGGFHLAAFGN